MPTIHFREKATLKGYCERSGHKSEGNWIISFSGMIEGQLSFLPDVTMYAGVDDPLTGGFIATGVFQAAVLQPLSVRGNATADFIQYSWAHSGWFQIPKF